MCSFVSRFECKKWTVYEYFLLHDMLSSVLLWFYAVSLLLPVIPAVLSLSSLRSHVHVSVHHREYIWQCCFLFFQFTFLSLIFLPLSPRALSYSQDIKVIHTKDLIKGLYCPKIQSLLFTFVSTHSTFAVLSTCLYFLLSFSLCPSSFTHLRLYLWSHYSVPVFDRVTQTHTHTHSQTRTDKSQDVWLLFVLHPEAWLSISIYVCVN